MQSTNLPAKYVVPFAQNDTAKVEIPVTTASPGRASLTLGFPPLTSQPPETGGVPPQLEDFNGAMNQVSRVAWWMMAGGQWPYDETFATDSNIGGYAQGAKLPSSDWQGGWVSLIDNNTDNPNTTFGNWAPLYAYGAYTNASTVGGSVTLTPVQAMKRTLVFSGTLAADQIIIVPPWVYDWTVYNATAGAFALTIKTAAGTGVVIPQNNTPTRIAGDGTNVALVSAAVSTSGGRLIGTQVFTANGTYTATPGTNYIIVEAVGGGGGAGGVPGSSTHEASSGGGGGYYVKGRINGALSGIAVAIGAGGAGTTGAGVSGGSTSFGTLIICGGGGGSPVGGFATFSQAGLGATSVTIDPSVAVIAQTSGSAGGTGYASNSGSVGGIGGASGLGLSYSANVNGQVVPAPVPNCGCGGSGPGRDTSGAAIAGGSGSSGVVIVYEYS